MIILIFLKQFLQNEEKEEAYVLLKDVLNMIHNDIAEKQIKDPAKKGKRPFHKALQYVLDQVNQETKSFQTYW